MQNPFVRCRRALRATRWSALAVVPLALAACSEDSLTFEESMMGVSITRVEGVVVDATTGDPLPGARVELVDTNTNVAETRVFTNSRGEFAAETPDAMSATRVQVTHGSQIVTGYPTPPMPAYAIRRMPADHDVTVRLRPMALLVLNLESSGPLAPGSRLEITINDAPPLLYSGDVPDRKFAGVAAGDVRVSWEVTGPGGIGRSGATTIECGKFGATEMDIAF